MLEAILLDKEKYEESTIKEGDLYKVIDLRGQKFVLLYGYYDECERQNPLIDPMPIYPDFIKTPQYTDDHFAFVTMMQDACKHYKGKEIQNKECAECEYYAHGDELLGVCTCKKNQRPT